MDSSEPIRFNCSRCGKGLRVASEAAGRRIRCPKCAELATVPFPLESEAELPEPQVKPAGGLVWREEVICHVRGTSGTASETRWRSRPMGTTFSAH